MIILPETGLGCMNVRAVCPMWSMLCVRVHRSSLSTLQHCVGKVALTVWVRSGWVGGYSVSLFCEFVTEPLCNTEIPYLVHWTGAQTHYQVQAMVFIFSSLMASKWAKNRCCSFSLYYFFFLGKIYNIFLFSWLIHQFPPDTPYEISRRHFSLL